MDFAKRLKELRKESGYTQVELTKKLGLAGQGAYQKYESGKGKPRANRLQELADIFGVSTSYLLGETDNKSDSEINHIINQLSNTRKAKVVNFAKLQLHEQQQEDNIISIRESLTEYKVYEKVSAGTGYGYLEDRNFDIVYYDEDIKHDLATWIFGDSMEPNFHNGNVALIQEDSYYINGAVYAIDWDGQSYIKKVYKEKDGLRLVSLNKKYNDKLAPFSENPRIIGKVVDSFQPIEK